MLPRAVVLSGLILIVGLALGLRLGGIAWQLPWHLHPDEAHYVWSAVDMVRDGNLNPKYFRNPSLYTYVLALEFEPLSLLGLTGLASGAAWEALRPPSLFTLLGRLSTALFGTATVVVVFRTASELFGGAVGLIASLLLAVSFLHVRDSQFATNDVPATFFLSVSVMFSVFLLRSGSSRHALLAALFGGLATSTKYNAGFFVVPLVAAYVLAFRQRLVTRGSLATLARVAVVSVGAYLVGTPFTLLAWPEFKAEFLIQQRFARQAWEGQGPEPVAFLYLTTLGQGLGWVALALAAVGLILLARRRPGVAAVLAGYPLAYLVFMFGVKVFFARFAVTLAPFLCIAAAYAIVELARYGRARLSHPALVSGLLVAAVIQPIWNDIEHYRILAQTDTRALAYNWLEQNLTAGARIVADEYSVRDFRPRGDLPDRARFDLDMVKAMTRHELSDYIQAGYRYAVTSSFQSSRFLMNDTYAALGREARELAVFAPTADGRELPFDIEELYSPYYDLGRYARPGPTIRVYELRGLD